MCSPQSKSTCTPSTCACMQNIASQIVEIHEANTFRASNAPAKPLVKSQSGAGPLRLCSVKQLQLKVCPRFEASERLSRGSIMRHTWPQLQVIDSLCTHANDTTGRKKRARGTRTQAGTQHKRTSTRTHTHTHATQGGTRPQSVPNAREGPDPRRGGSLEGGDASPPLPGPA